MTDTKKTLSGKVRFHENDRLTVFATGIVFLFHCARYFNDEGWHVKNPDESVVLSYAVIMVSQWVMPLFFLLSGMSSGFSLKSRGAGAYLAGRVRRLMVPFMFNVLVISIPLQVWVERVSHGEFTGSFLEFYPQYFDGLYAFGGNFAWMGLHLWYLLMLFLFSALTLPLLLAMKAWGGSRVVPWLARACKRPGGVFIFAPALYVVEYFVNQDPEGIGMRAFGGWSPLSYLLVFIIGYLLSQSPEFREGFKRNAFAALALGVAATTLMLLGHAKLVSVPAPFAYPVRIAVRSLNSWAWIAAIYGLGCAYLSSATARLPRQREMALPFYILHQTVIVGFGYLMLSWNMPVALKYALLAASSLAAILASMALIKRIRPLRPCFGMSADRR